MDIVDRTRTHISIISLPSRRATKQLRIFCEVGTKKGPLLLFNANRSKTRKKMSKAKAPNFSWSPRLNEQDVYYERDSNQVILRGQLRKLTKLGTELLARKNFFMHQNIQRTFEYFPIPIQFISRRFGQDAQNLIVMLH